MERKANRYFFGLGTLGRDTLYTLESMYLIYYLTEILNLSDAVMATMTTILTVLRIFDAFNDPIMGVLVDNTKTRWGKFKPWILIGGIIGGILTVCMFTDFGLTGPLYLVSFTIFYLLWDFTYGANDIAYWSMLPALSTNQAEREKTGAFARICANIGMYFCVVGILPITGLMTKAFDGDAEKAWFLFAVGAVVLMLVFLSFTLFGVKEKKGVYRVENTTSIKEMFGVLFKNDQLMWTAVAMALFMIGYCTTTTFGTYYFKYAFKNEGMYSVFAGVLGVSQLTALAVFPLISKKISRKKFYTLATILVFIGYIIFFVTPTSDIKYMIPVGVAGVLLFVGEAFIQLLMLMFLADTVEYGQLKLGKRNESVTFSVQPFINKIGAAIATGIVGYTVIISGINSAVTPEDVTSEGLLIMKLAMMILPLIAIIAGYLVYRFKFKIDEHKYAEILSELKEKGYIKE